MQIVSDGIYMYHDHRRSCNSQAQAGHGFFRHFAQLEEPNRFEDTTTLPVKQSETRCVSLHRYRSTCSTLGTGHFTAEKRWDSLCFALSHLGKNMHLHKLELPSCRSSWHDDSPKSQRSHVRDASVFRMTAEVEWSESGAFMKSTGPLVPSRPCR